MDINLLIAIITSATSIIIAAISYYLTKSNQLKQDWRQKKMEHYKELLSAISDLAIDGIDKNSANIRFASMANTICLVANQKVINSLMEFHDYVKFSNKDRSIDKEEFLLKKLLLEIRKDIGLTKRDNFRTFNFHLIGSIPK